MTWVAVGVGSAAVVGGLIASDSSSKASKAQLQSANQSIAAQNAQLGMTRSDNAPFLKTGTDANARLAQLLGLGDPQAAVRDKAATAAGIKKPTLADAENVHLQMHMQKFGSGYTSGSDMAAKERQVQDIYNGMLSDYTSKVALIAPDTSAGGAVDSEFGSLTKKFTQADIDADPVYQSGLKFGLDRGTEGINARATASGMHDSGATLKALTSFSNDYASTKANESYNRFTNDQSGIYNKLAGISGTGQVASGQVAAAGANAANNISNDITGAGNARAAGIVGGANAWGGAINTGANAANNYESNKRLQALLAQRQGGSYAPASYDYGLE